MSTRPILALHPGHNASACISDGRQVSFAVQEERLTGEKNYWGYPRQAVSACLGALGVTPGDLGAVVVGSRQNLTRYHSREDVIESYRRFESFTGKLRQRVTIPLLVAMKDDIGQAPLKRELAADRLDGVPLGFYDHHTAHAATAYFGLRADPETKYLVVTCDGAGDGVCASVRVWGGGSVDVISQTSWQHSLGAIYSWMTYAMGFVPLEHEYKLMGMAPYASDKTAKEAAKMFEGYLGLDSTGLRFRRKGLIATDNFVSRMLVDMRGKRFDWLCAGLQRFTEDLLCEWIQNAVRRTGVRKVLAAGGVFMNVKANKRIAELPEVESFEAFPSCGDETLPFGAVWMEIERQHGHRAPERLRDFYTGDDVDPAECEHELRASGFTFDRPTDVADAVAGLLVKGEPVARCAGRMEFGARALGNRSILADPSNQDVVRVINQMVKKRDFWMPFAPMVIARRQQEYLVNPKGLTSPYMMMTFDTRENFREFIAAVHNADLTCRAQILDEARNPEMYRILEAFERKTGRGIVLNTSFNLHGFPIVRTAREALHVLRDSGLRHLQLGPWLVRKP